MQIVYKSIKLYAHTAPCTLYPRSPQVVWAYLTISALASFAVTYYFDSHDNYKLHNILKWSMKLLGLGAVATSTTLPEASVSAAGVLVVVDALWKLLGRCALGWVECVLWCCYVWVVLMTT